jgi:hypothetical protein
MQRVAEHAAAQVSDSLRCQTLLLLWSGALLLASSFKLRRLRLAVWPLAWSIKCAAEVTWGVTS